MEDEDDTSCDSAERTHSFSTAMTINFDIIRENLFPLLKYGGRRSESSSRDTDEDGDESRYRGPFPCWNHRLCKAACKDAWRNGAGYGRRT